MPFLLISEAEILFHLLKIILGFCALDLSLFLWSRTNSTLHALFHLLQAFSSQSTSFPVVYNLLISLSEMSPGCYPIPSSLPAKAKSQHFFFPLSCSQLTATQFTATSLRISWTLNENYQIWCYYLLFPFQTFLGFHDTTFSWLLLSDYFFFSFSSFSITSSYWPKFTSQATFLFLCYNMCWRPHCSIGFDYHPHISTLKRVFLASTSLLNASIIF